MHALSLERVTPISWASLHSQFGAGFKHTRQFRPQFLDALSAATAAYPEANVSLSDAGVTLGPSRSPVRKIA